LPLCTLFANPHDPKLSLVLIMLDMEDLALFDQANHSLQHGSTIADVSNLDMLSEGHGFSVDSPDSHSQECGHTSIATTIHNVRWKGLMEWYDMRRVIETYDSHSKRVPEVTLHATR
jgi:hypothetical protein